MSAIMNILTKAGYEINSTGNNVLPAALTRDGEPVGFLMPDLTVSLVTEKTHFKDSIQNALDFAIENNDLQQMDGEYILTQYGKTVLTADYDFEEQHAVYKIYSLDGGGRTIIDSFDQKEQATAKFAELSGLVGGDRGQVLQNEKIRIDTFVSKLTEKGYKIITALSDAHRAYEITDKNDAVIGYISKTNKLTLITDNQAQRKDLTDTYLNTSNRTVVLPTFFERLKNLLIGIGLALKVHFTSQGQHYSINDKNVQIATVDALQNVVYTPQATSEHMERIDQIVSEIKQEIATPTVVQEVKIPVMAQEFAQTLTLTNADIAALSTAILSSPQLTQTLSAELVEKLITLNEHETVHEPSHELPLSQEQIAVANEFNAFLDVLSTLDGFNPEKYDQTVEKMQAKFKTTDQKEFVSNLKNGDYTKIAGPLTTLNDKILNSKDKAASINNDHSPNKGTAGKEI